MSEEYFYPTDCTDQSIASEQYSIPSLPRPETKATVKVVPVPEVPPAPEQ